VGLSQSSGSVGHSKHRKAFGVRRGNMRPCADWLAREEAKRPRRLRCAMYATVEECMRAEGRKPRRR
jgi:hypothetical protein